MIAKRRDKMQTQNQSAPRTKSRSPKKNGESVAVEFPSLPDEKFDIIYADPPWHYKGQLQHAGKGSGDTGGAERHYPTVTLDDLVKLPVEKIAAANSLLFLWATSPHLDQALDLGRGWGFDWATVGFIWNKMRTNPGFYTLSQCELCLIFKRGKIPQPRGRRDISQYVEEERGRHSEKPGEVRKRIEQMFPKQTKLELFARKRTRGWKAWGLEIDVAQRTGTASQMAR